MAAGSIQLSASAQAVATAAGSATITFPSVRLARTLQGSVSISGSPPGQAWTVSVGGSVLGTLFAPGPFGPVQIQSGQALQISATNILTPGSTYIASLSGVDDPSNNASPYSGPASVTVPGNQGGLLHASAGWDAPVGKANLLLGPPAGYAYRLHSAVCYVFTTSATTLALAEYLYDQNTQFIYNAFVVPIGTNGYILNNFLFNGLLVTGDITYQAAGTVPTGSFGAAFLCYDLVAI